jgi:5-methylcytosine-specific restriction endonuclease McrA
VGSGHLISSPMRSLSFEGMARIATPRQQPTVRAADSYRASLERAAGLSGSLGTCAICGEQVFRCFKYPHGFSPSIDHIRPRAKGGPDSLGNFQLTHLRCNQQKGVKTMRQVRAAQVAPRLRLARKIAQRPAVSATEAELSRLLRGVPTRRPSL